MSPNTPAPEDEDWAEVGVYEKVFLVALWILGTMEDLASVSEDALTMLGRIPLGAE